MPLFICPRFPEFRLLVEQKPGYNRGTKYYQPPPMYAEFKMRQFYTSDETIAQTIRETKDFMDNVIVEVPDAAYRENMSKAPETILAELDEEKLEQKKMAENTCRYCGQVCKSPQGLGMHMKRCQRRLADEPAPADEPDAADGVDQPEPV